MNKNIVMILTDQMHKYAMGFLRDHIHTPHLDRLAGEGVTFTHAYANNPVCGPFRGNLFTGMHTCSNGMEINGAPLPDMECMADTFNANGYETSFVGKWHLGDEGNKPIPENLRGGFRHFIGYQCYNGFNQDVCFYDEELTEHPFLRHRTDVTTELGIERLKKVACTGNSFLHVIFYQAPHYPEEPSEAYYDLYKDKTMPYPPNYQAIDPYTPTFSPPSPKPFEKDPTYQQYGNDMQAYMRMYNAMVTQIDHGVGQILSALDELDLADDTLILFSSDHGDMQGSHGLKNKCLPYEESAGIPLIIKAPGCRSDYRVETPVSSVDFYPTVVDYAGAKTTRGFEGRTLVPFLTSQSESRPDTVTPVFSENYLGEQQWTMIRDAQYKLVVDKKDGSPYLLFDMENDPFEMNNLVEDPHYLTVRNKLQKQLESFLEDGTRRRVV